MLQEMFFQSIYGNLYNSGIVTFPRGQEVLEIENYSIVFNPYYRFINFKSRNLNLDYIKREFVWYLKGNRFDTSIANYASIWKNIINKDGSINSNYGQYIFSKDCNQFDNVAHTLINDTDSRRASIMILQPFHLLSDSNDIPCTYSLNFRIRQNKLNMSVHMRSQDAVFGLCNDLPTFSFIHEMLLRYLQKVDKFKNLEYGQYFHCVDSFHVYKRHYSILESIASGRDTFTEIHIPAIDTNEAALLSKNTFCKSYLFTEWLLNLETENKETKNV